MDSNRHGDVIMNIIFMYTTLRRKSKGVPVNNGRISNIQDTRYCLETGILKEFVSEMCFDINW